MLTSGVTTVVDAGSAGAETFLRQKQMVMDRSAIRVLAFLNIVANGMNGGLEQTSDQMDPQVCAETIEKYRDVIVGVKTAHYWTEKPWDAEHRLWTAVDRALECGRLAKVPLMVDFWPRPPQRSYADLILKKMRPGDIHTHVFAQQFPIILPNGRLNPILTKARRRGVMFDVGHGAGSFWFRNAVPAVEQGFLPDSISTDLHTSSMNAGMKDQLNVMSKFLALGVPVARPKASAATPRCIVRMNRRNCIAIMPMPTRICTNTISDGSQISSRCHVPPTRPMRSQVTIEQ